MLAVTVVAPVDEVAVEGDRLGIRDAGDEVAFDAGPVEFGATDAMAPRFDPVDMGRIDGDGPGVDRDEALGG